MALALTLKRHDNYPPISTTLTDSKGPIDLTLATAVKFQMKLQGGSTLVTGAAAVIDAPNGKVQYSWGPTDTGVAGTYDTEWEISWPGGGVQTVPNAASANEQVEIDADLENA